MTLIYVLLAAILAVSGFVAWKVLGSGGSPDAARDKLQGELDQLRQEAAHLNAALEQRSEEIGALRRSVEAERSEKNELQGKGKQLHAAYQKLELKLEQLEQERDALKKLVTKHDAEATRLQKEADDRLAKLEAAKVSLDQERARVIRAEEEARKRLEEERDRVWNDHEVTVVSRMTDLCKQPALSFTSFTNTNLPEGFDGSLKPDFMIEFLGQYVIFDAKVSKAKSLKTYVSDQVKKTVEKVKDNEKIYKSIFLVVPTSALGELSAHHHTVDGFNIFVVSLEAVPAILASFKRISMYEKFEQMDPEQRENIIQLLADLDFHINLRNAADLILTKMGTEILEKAQRVDPQIAEEVALKKLPMNAKASIAASELKKIVSKLTTQVEEVQALVSPSAPVKKKSLKGAEAVISETLFS